MTRTSTLKLLTPLIAILSITFLIFCAFQAKADIIQYYAHLNKNNIVDNVIVASNKFIQSGIVGDPQQWIETFKYTPTYAGKGDQYINTVFQKADILVINTTTDSATSSEIIK